MMVSSPVHMVPLGDGRSAGARTLSAAPSGSVVSTPSSSESCRFLQGRVMKDGTSG